MQKLFEFGSFKDVCIERFRSRRSGAFRFRFRSIGWRGNRQANEPADEQKEQPDTKLAGTKKGPVFHVAKLPRDSSEVHQIDLFSQPAAVVRTQTRCRRSHLS